MSELHLLVLLLIVGSVRGDGGRWELLQESIGVSAMHMQLLHTDHVIIFDRTDFGRSNLSLPHGICRHDPTERVLKVDCTAHSVEFSVLRNTFRPLMVLTDTWCSSGAVGPNGTLIQSGGWSDGDQAVRLFTPCGDARCDWSEDAQGLAKRRWYASNQILPDGRVIVVGGRGQFNYEFLPHGNLKNFFPLPFLQQTSDPEENNLYPFVHLNVDGKLFIYANNRAILFDYENNRVVRAYPKMPDGHPRNYPSTGSSVLLPIKPPYTEAEVLVCGGAPTGSYLLVHDKKQFMRALSMCGRLKITDKSPAWTVETMPTPRVMGDMVLLPNGEVLLINGAAAGAAGWELGADPVYTPVVYRLDRPAGERFKVQRPSSIPRLYHSTALLLRDGRVLVGGSNPHQFYVFSGVKYPTELSLEVFEPEYASATNLPSRPSITMPPISLRYGQRFKVQFTVGVIYNDTMFVTMMAPSFATHSFSMNQRLLVLETGEAVKVAKGSYQVTAAVPASSILAPPGYYMLFVVNNMVPSVGIWAHIE